MKERPHLSDAELAAVADGRVFTGRQGIANKLVDRLGGEREAVAWLETKGVAKDLPIRDWKRPSRAGVFSFFTSASAVAAAARVSTASRPVVAARCARADGVVLDGLLAIWQG